MKISFIMQLVVAGCGLRAECARATRNAQLATWSSPSSPPPPDPSALHESVVMTHHQLRLDLLDGVHGHADHDQQRGAAEVEVEAHAGSHPYRKEAVQPGADAERD